MTFLSLAKGDPAARTLIGNAVKARYGVRPVSLSSLDLQLTTSARGPLGLPTQQTLRIRLIGSTHWRCDQAQTLFGFGLKRQTESYDGGTRYALDGGKKTESADPAMVIGVRQQAWLWLALFLTPLTEEGVTLKSIDEHTLQASPSANAAERARLTFNADYTLDAAEAEWQPGNVESAMHVTLRPTGELRLFGDFPMSSTLTISRKDAPDQQYALAALVANPKIPLMDFTLS